MHLWQKHHRSKHSYCRLRMFILVKWLILYLLGVSTIILLKSTYIVDGTLKLYISCFLSKLYIFIFNFHVIWTHGFQVHSMCYNPLLPFFILKLKGSQIWPMETPPGELGVFGECPFHSSSIKGCTQPNLSLSQPQSWNNHFPKECCFLLGQCEKASIWMLAASGESLLPRPHSGQRERIYVDRWW